MNTTGVKDFCLKLKIMKRVRFLALLGLAIFCLMITCKNNGDKKETVSSNDYPADTAGLMLIGKDIITDIILKPDTTGDQWEVEKVKGFSGERMFKLLFDRIYSEKLTVYDCREEKMLNATEIKDLEKEFNSDLSKIGKAQFTEDWYFDTNKNIIVKKTKSVSFGFELNTAPDVPARYKALFRIKI
jgi:hypothetical protein